MGILSSTLSAAWLRVVALLASVALAVVGIVVAAPVARADGLPPTLATDQADYVPGSVVNLSGDHWAPGSPVHIRVDDNVGAGWYLDSSPDPVAGADGSMSYAFRIPFTVIALYTVVATQAQSDGSVLTASTTFTDNAGANLDQCANGKNGGETCTGANWQNGNINTNNSKYFEGDSVPYRMAVTGLTTNTQHSVVFEWDLTEGGNWAYDYLTSWDRTVGGSASDPCDGIFASCISKPAVIPTDTEVAAKNTIKGASYTQIPGSLQAFVPAGESIDNLAIAYDGSILGTTSGASERRMIITFKSSSSSIVFAWAGHIATRADWGVKTAVASISGSPYHMRFIRLDAESGGGNQDRSLKADAVIFPGKITITKKTDPAGSSQSFPFTAAGGTLAPTSFNLTDGQSQLYSNITDFRTYTFTEGTSTGWTLSGLSCSVEFPNGGTKSETIGTRTASLSIAEGEYWTCLFTNKANPKALTVSKTFTPTYTRTYSYGITKDVDKTSVSIADGGTATFNYTVKATKSFADSAFGGSGKITVTNPNAAAVTGVNVTDATTNGVSCTVANGTNLTVPANGSLVLDYSCSALPTKPADGTNTATATWSTQTVNGASLPGGNAKGDAAMSWSGAPTTIQNQSVTVKDDQATADPSDDKTLGTMSYTDPSPQTYTYSLSFPGVGGTCTDYTNTASLSSGPTASKTVKVCVGKDLSVSKTVTPRFGRTYSWDIEKRVDQTEFKTSAGGKVTANYTIKVTNSSVDGAFQLTGTITVTNPNDWQDVVVSVSDAANAGNATCLVAGSASTTVTVPKRVGTTDGSKTVNYVCTLATANSITTGTNTATATWDKTLYKTPTGSAQGTAAYSFVDVKPSITNGTITVNDDKTTGTPAFLKEFSYVDGSPQTTTYQVEFTAPSGTCATYDNTATIVENGKSAGASVKVCGAVAPTATKKGAGSYNSAYGWKIDKVAGAKQTLPDGTTPIKVSYTVTVTQTSYSESGATASGTIKVSNANDWEAVDVAVSDSMGAGSTCLVDGVASRAVSVPASGDVTLTWSCSVASVPTTKTVKNIATVTWDKAKAYTATGSTTAEADIVFALGSATDATVTVTDAFNGGAAAELEKVTGVASSNPADWFSKQYPLSYDVTPKAGTCTKYPNEAAITGVDKADATAEVCVAKDLTVAKDGTGSYDEAYFWDITKKASPSSQTVPAGTTASIDYQVTASQTGYSQSNAKVSGTITITNPNDFQAITVDLTDSLPGATCAFTQSGVGITGSAIQVAASGTVKVDYSCVYATVPADKKVTNTAKITWDKAAASTPNGSVEGTAGIELSLDASTDKTVTVTDAFNGGAAETKGTLTGVPSLDGSAWTTKTWTYSRSVTAPAGTCAEYKNTASVYGDSEALLGSAKAAATVCGALNLTIDKTASGTYDRAATWEITKTASPTDSVVPAGQGQKVGYTVTVTQKSYTESNATVSGTITVTNPNKFGGPLDVTVTDSLGVAGTTCVIKEGTTTLVGGKATVGQDASKTFDYSCTYDLFVPADKNQTNSATVSWDKAQMNSSKSSANVDKAFTLAVGKSTDIDITVTDTFDGGAPVPLGSLSATTAAPYTTKAYTYDRTITPPAGTCVVKANTATIVGTEQDASATVKVCGAVAPTATKKGAGTFNSTYGWEIDKVAGAKQTVPAGTSPIEVSYTVTVKQTAYSETGASASGTITVSNGNDFQALDVAVSDSMGAGSTCVVDGVASATARVPASGSVTLDWSCVFDPAPTSRTIENVATITWDKTKAHTATGSTTAKADIDFTLGTATDATVTVTDTFNGGAAVELEKVTGVASSNPADWFSKQYPLSYHVTPKAGTCTKYPNEAAITGIDKADATAEVCVAEDLTVENSGSGSYDEAFTWDITKKASPSTQTVPAGTEATIDYEVVAKQTGYSQSNGTASGTITITNPNDFQAITVDLTDSLPGATCTFTKSGLVIDGKALTVAASGTVKVDYSCTYSTVPEGKKVTNTATITWDQEAASTPSGTAQGHADFELALRNSKDKVVTIKDAFNGQAEETKGTLTGVPSFDKAFWVTAVASLKYDRTVTAPDGTCSTYDNTASITGDEDAVLDSAKASASVCGALDLTIDRTATGTYDRAATWDITKSASPTYSVVPAGSGKDVGYTVTVTQKSYSESNAKVSGAITVTNPNKFGGPLDITVTDSLGLGSTATCVITDGGTVLSGGKATVAQDASKTFDYTCTYTFVPTDKAQTNSATVSWDKAQMNSSTSSATVNKAFDLALGKSTNIDITVTDTYDGTTSELGKLTAKADGTASATYTYKRTITPAAGTCLTKDNTAKITETGQTAGASAKVCAAADLTVSKTANPSFTRTYAWSISKSVDKTTVQIPAGSATFNYTVVASQTGYTDSLWKVAGTITVTNPNTFQDITADITDSLPGATCDVTGGKAVTVSAGKSVSVNYVCTFTTSQTGATVSNTATATWDQATYGTPKGSAAGTAGATFGSPSTTVNKTITVTDTWDGATQTLGTVTASDTTPYATRTFTYSKTVAAPAAGTCVTKNNTAVIVETGQSASQSVRVCGPDRLGSRTIGFWQNKNGQGIIKGGAAPGGVCASGTWLRQFKPYQDLSATASCAQVASYVYGIIKAASSAGSTMNPMLKAQMLATALDVYFSDKDLGGNKLGAPQPIGPRVIDLTQVCKYLGSTSCSGSLYDVSSVFGGSPKTVLEMLAYASSQSNVGGTFWYSNVKSTQEKAKDAFDAINNDQVLVVG